MEACCSSNKSPFNKELNNPNWEPVANVVAELWGHADVDLKVQKCPCVKHGDVLGKYSHVINMGLF